MKKEFKSKVKFDHVALHTTKEKMKESVAWYTQFLDGKVLHQDDSWSLIEGSGVKVALIIPEQHPPHVGFEITVEKYRSLKKKGRKFKLHRDGSESIYIVDPNGNNLEMVFWRNSYVQKAKSKIKKILGDYPIPDWSKSRFRQRK